MGFVKIVKTNAYFKRYQTKFRRRISGKTDYYSRKRMIVQDKDKYNTPKYRFVARITNQKVVCQIIYATLAGDKVLCQAESQELKRFGLTAGLKNYSSAYCTGLLCARRLLKQVGLDKFYEAQKVTGEHYSSGANPNPDRRPFKACLDVGLVKTTTGRKVFACLKGAVDGGIYIPHSTRRFPGFTKDGDVEKYDAKQHRDRIFGAHIDKYMQIVKKDSEDQYQKLFSQWDKCLKATKAKSVEALYTKIHDEIRKNPDFKKKEAKKAPKREHTKFRLTKLTADKKKEIKQRKLKIALGNK